MMSKAILAAVRTAKDSLGDLVVEASLQRISTVYNTATGVNDEIISSHVIEAAPVKLDYTEVMQGECRQSDLKLVVFSTGLDITTKDKIRFDNVAYFVVKVTPTLVGNTVAIFEVVIRK